MRFPERRTPDPVEVDARLAEDATITHVASVHCETTSGTLNPVELIGAVVKKHGPCSIVDAMSSFGAVPIDLEAAGIDFLVSSANKCIEGVPGFAFVIARRERLLETKSWARSLSLDLYSQWYGLERNGQFRFTPPTHTLLAFHQALVELDQEGGVDGRAARYRANHEALLAGMEEMGFVAYLEPELQSYIITSFCSPRDPRFDFEVSTGGSATGALLSTLESSRTRTVFALAPLAASSPTTSVDWWRPFGTTSARGRCVRRQFDLPLPRRVDRVIRRR